MDSGSENRRYALVMKRIVALPLAALILVAATATAQLPPGKWWRRPEIIQQLVLSDEQQDRLDAIFRSAANDLIDLRGSVEKQNIALRGLLDQPQLDRAAIHREAARLSEAKARLFDRELSMLVDMRAVLTDPQWNRMRNQLERLGAQRQQQQMRRNRPQ